MHPCLTVVCNAVATSVWCNEGLLLAAIEFALGWIYGVGVGWHGAFVKGYLVIEVIEVIEVIGVIGVIGY